MKQKFTDPRLVALNDDDGFQDDGMRRALLGALEPDENAIAAYSVSAHIWVHAVLTDRALLLVKGAVRARATRMPLPLEIARTPAGSKKGARVQTPLGKKTLWGSKLDPEARLLLGAGHSATRTLGSTRGTAAPRLRPLEEPGLDASETVSAQQPDADPLHLQDVVAGPHDAGAAKRTRRQARQAAGPRPRRPRLRRVRKQRIGFAPPSTIWDMAYNCVKCGRPLTDPRSRQARVGTKCIRIYGSQQRRIPNPAHAVWRDRKTQADVAYVAERVQAETEFARARTAYEQALAEWTRIRAAR